MSRLQHVRQRMIDLAIPERHALAGPEPVERSEALYVLRRARRSVMRHLHNVDRQNHAPMPLAELKSYLDGTGIRWRVTGMFALNARVGYLRQPHDLDIEIAHDDLPLIRAAMPDWEHYYVDAGAWVRWRSLRPPADVRRYVSRPGPNMPWAVEWLATRLDGDDWVYRYDRSVRMAWRPLDLGGVPYSPPAIPLLFKSHYLREKDFPDFEAAVPLLDHESLEWLASAISHGAPDHPWLPQIEALAAAG
jgi:hypothetical protein